MKLTIVLEKEVADIPEAESLTLIVRNKLGDHPEVKINASISEPIKND